jgi:hypothetical protein
LQQLNDLIVTAPEQLRGELHHGRSVERRPRSAEHCAPTRQHILDPTQAAKLALKSLSAASANSTREILASMFDFGFSGTSNASATPAAGAPASELRQSITNNNASQKAFAA